MLAWRGRPLTAIVVDAPAGRVDIQTCATQARAALATGTLLPPRPQTRSAGLVG